jgi:ubiquinone/menaquinone biosynthesis C-methylase UbiE
MRKLLFRLYWRLEKIFFPELKFSQYHYYDVLKARIPQACDWLDIGCGHHVLAEWMIGEQAELAARSRRFVGIDLDWSGLVKNPVIHHRIFGNAEALPLQSQSFDVVTANMVVEHLDRPDIVLAEVRRVLRPNGLFIFHTPNSRCLVIRVARITPQRLKILLAAVLEQRKEEDVFPTRYRMNTLAQIRSLSCKAGLYLEELRSVSTSAVTAMLGPVVIIELLYLRMLQRERFQDLRSNLIAVLRKTNGDNDGANVFT